jgi:hypothetical protein
LPALAPAYVTEMDLVGEKTPEILNALPIKKEDLF